MQFLLAAGAVLTLAVTGWWARSFWIADRITVSRTWHSGDQHVTGALASLEVENREFSAAWIWLRAPRAAGSMQPKPLGVVWHSRTAAPFQLLRRDGTIWRRLGFFHYNPGGAPAGVAHFVALPTWFVVLCCGALTAAPLSRLWRDRRRRRSRERAGLCVSCGYDLRAAAHRRCPECGHLVPSAPHGEPSLLSKMK
jgi:hypothetical protein